MDQLLVNGDLVWKYHRLGDRKSVFPAALQDDNLAEPTNL